MTHGLLIGAARTNGADGTGIEVTDPGTGERVASVASAAPADAYRACDEAARAGARWRALAPRERSEVLLDVHRLMLDHCDELARLITLENGKPLADALGEVAYAAEFFRWNAEEAVRLRGTIATAPGGGVRQLVSHRPVGVVAVITPWNFPAAMMTRKVAPALAAGNTVVVKPAAETPLTALRLGELMLEAGVPPGVVNVTPAADPGGWLDATVDHPSTRMVTFTGSTEVGRRVLHAAADRVLRTTMELGGNAPFLVFADADLDAAVEGALVAKMRHSSQTCTAANRFYVHEAVVDEFAERFASAMGEVRVGHGLDHGVDCGPLISSGAVQRVDGLVRSAVGAGARVVCGGSPVDRPGHFYRPTVLELPFGGHDIVRSEIFGPVAPVMRFGDGDDVVAAANDTEAGLMAYVYTADLARGLAVSEQLEAGMVGLNVGVVSDPSAPFGGMKQSGLGREGGEEGIREFCESQYIATRW